MHEVRPDPVAQIVHLVHVAVRRIRETVSVDATGARLGVTHLGPRHQGQALGHRARRVGLVGLGEHEVDRRLDRGGAARRLARARRIDDGHVDRHLRPCPARGSDEVNRFQPVQPEDGCAGLGCEDVQLFETRLL